MPEYYLINPNLPDQAITVHVEDGQELSQEYGRSGWVEGTPPPAEVEDETTVNGDLDLGHQDGDGTAELTDEKPPPEQADNPLDLTKEK